MCVFAEAFVDLSDSADDPEWSEGQSEESEDEQDGGDSSSAHQSILGDFVPSQSTRSCGNTSDGSTTISSPEVQVCIIICINVPLPSCCNSSMGTESLARDAVFALFHERFNNGGCVLRS